MNRALIKTTPKNVGVGLQWIVTIIGGLIIGLILLAGCRSEPPTPGPSVPGISLEITAENCPNAVVDINQQVTWTNKDSQEHTVVDVTPDGSVRFDGGILHEGDSFSYLFINPGRYDYICTADGNMRGQITVK